MELVTEEINGALYAKVQDGKPVYRDGDQEVAFDAVTLRGNLSRNGKEMKEMRDKLEAFKAFEGMDAAEARKAIELAANLDAKKLMEAGEVEKMKAEMAKGFQSQIEEANSRASSFEAQLYEAIVGSAFRGSPYFQKDGKYTMPAELAQSYFAKNFKVEHGRIVAYDQHGQRIYNSSGDLAGFEEAIDKMIGAAPFRDSVTRASGMQGSGSPAGNGKHGGKKSVTRDQFESMSPHERAKVATSGVEIVD